MRISDWSSDVCSSDLSDSGHAGYRRHVRRRAWLSTALVLERASWGALLPTDPYLRHRDRQAGGHAAAHRQDAFWKGGGGAHPTPGASTRSEARRLGQEWDSTCSSRWWPEHYK